MLATENNINFIKINGNSTVRYVAHVLIFTSNNKRLQM